MAQIQGNVQVSSVQTAQVAADVDGQVYLLDPDSTPLMALLNAIKQTRTVENIRYDILQQQLFTRFVTTTGYLIGATTGLNVSDSTGMVVGNLLLNKNTGEIMRITNIPSSTSVDVTRAHGETAAAAGTNGDTIWVLGSSYAEFQDTPSANTRQLDNAYNYTQIFRRSMAVSNTAKSVKMYSGNEEERELADLGREFAIDQEMSALFGQRYNSAGGTRGSRGLLKSIVTNVYNAAGTMTEANWEANVLEPVFRWGSSQKILLASPKLCTTLDYWGRQKLQFMAPADNASLGIKVAKYMSTHGELLVIRHKLLQGAWNGVGFILDPKYFRRCVMKGRGPQLLKNRQGNGIDGVIHEFLAEMGWENMREETHAYVYGVTGGA